ncbi:MAG: ferredoxin [Dehalococcoidia bacterium]|nr:MAG: ferredoxin [Dehalococcoidia bacterium]
MDCTIIFDGTEIKARANSNLLWTALDNGFYIPNLCSIKNIDRPFASCRLCFVEIAGRPGPVTACTETVLDGMKVTLHSPEINRLRKSSFDLLLSNHRLDCGRCTKNRNCDLHKIARSENFKLIGSPLKTIDFKLPVDSSHPLFSLDRNKCVLCGKCIWVCRQNGEGILDFAFRGISTSVSTFAGLPLSETSCNSCLACVNICPVGALYLKNPQREEINV